ncbi:MAG: glycyl-radical enzyme activating protein [Deltaproteobacteria bacterium]|nr:glycyl-radical enzyme activating protein [Candidatus Zymogenaceae bacterium]
MGIVFDIQTYAIYDGPGIRTCVFFKGCPLSCVWCHNPESQRLQPEMGYRADRCAGCGSCVEACPHDALVLEGDGVRRDTGRCVVCGLCEKVCRADAHEKIGYKTSAEAVVEKVIADRPFFTESSGGVTLTGGEPTVQREFLLETAGLLKKSEIHTALETCGHFGKELMPALIDTIDLFLYDIKHADADTHKRFTGVDNRVILENFVSIVRKAGPPRIIPRIPLIPGFNADGASLKGICRFLKEARYEGPVHLMPYNSMAKSKYEKLGRGVQYQNMGELSGDMIDGFVGLVRDNGFEAVINH